MNPENIRTLLDSIAELTDSEIETERKVAAIWENCDEQDLINLKTFIGWFAAAE